MSTRAHLDFVEIAVYGGAGEEADSHPAINHDTSSEGTCWGTMRVPFTEHFCNFGEF